MGVLLRTTPKEGVRWTKRHRLEACRSPRPRLREVVPGALHHGPAARVPHAEALAHAAAEEDLSDSQNPWCVCVCCAGVCAHVCVCVSVR